jgi:Skp family chaperone for outer membrane proteins
MKLTLVALALLPLSAALAQTVSEPPAAPGTQQTAPAPADLDATRHHQPTRAEVTERLKERQGSAAVDQQNQREQADVDQLYRQLMRDTAPSSGK